MFASYLSVGTPPQPLLYAVRLLSEIWAWGIHSYVEKVGIDLEERGVTGEKDVQSADHDIYSV